MKSNRFWFIVLGGVLLVSVAASILIRQTPAAKALIFKDGVLIETLDLSAVTEPYSFTVESGDGINVISAERGRIRISDADCPDGSCVRQGWISDGLLPIVCLPHRLVIMLEGSDTNGNEIDAIVG